MLDIMKVQEALDRAAHKAIRGTREERSGRFLGNRHVRDIRLSDRPRDQDDDGSVPLQSSDDDQSP